MKDLNSYCRLAIVQAAPVMFDKDACLEKAIRLIEEAAQNGAELIVFPELFLPGYPYGMTFGYTVGSRKEPGRADWKIYYDNSILSNGAEMQQLIDCAKRLDVYLSFGYSERDAQTATLYNSNMLISPQGQALNHRKLKPTGAERLVWGDAQCDFFPVMDTPWGKIGSLICWESYMPLARAALYEKGITIYISPNTNDNPEWQHTIRHILPLSRTATLSTPICSSAARITPKQAAARTKLPAFRGLPAAAAAASLTPSDMRRARPSGMKKRSSTPTSTCRRFLPAAWNLTAADTMQDPMFCN